jgi:hypothetical protein
MKQTPKELAIQAMMEPGVLSLSGFLGTDDRHFHEIIADDENTLNRLDYEAEQITQRMEKLMELAMDAYQEPMIVEAHFQIEIESLRGKMRCPFIHPGAYDKGIIHLTNLSNNITVKWTPLSIHFIKTHHFFEGKGSPFRIEPELLIKAIFE